jgi:hypothetical protein
MRALTFVVSVVSLLLFLFLTYSYSVQGNILVALLWGSTSVCWLVVIIFQAKILSK